MDSPWQERMFQKARHLPGPAHARQDVPFLGQGRRRDGNGTDWAVVRTTARRESRWPTRAFARASFSTCPGGETQFISVKTELPYLKVSRTGTRLLGSQEKTKM